MEELTIVRLVFVLNAIFNPLLAFVEGAPVIELALQAAMQGHGAFIAVVANADAVEYLNFALAKYAFGHNSYVIASPPQADEAIPRMSS